MRVTHLLLMSLLLAGCVDQLHEEAHALTYLETTTSSTGESELPTTTQAATGGGVQTVTGETTLEATTSSVDDTTATTGESVDLPPTVDLFAAEPDQLSEAGKSLLHLQTSADVVQVRLFQNDEPIADLEPADFPYTYEAFSAKNNGDPHTFRVEVKDAGGQTAAKDLKLKVVLPLSGAERCLFLDMGAKGSAIFGLVHATDAIVAVGWRDTGAGPRMAIWKLDKKNCTVLPGWPRTIVNWSPALAGQTSRAVGVAIDEAGYIAIAANLWPGGKPQLYAALLTPEGARIWEHTGDVGEEAAGVATGVDHRVFVVGARRTSDNPVRTDARVWGFRFSEDIVTVWLTDLKAPFTPDEAFPDDDNVRSERARAVVVGNDEVVVVGEREFRGGDFNIYTRTFIARYFPFGKAVAAPWTSPGDFFLHEAMNAVGLCGADLIAGGWTRDTAPGASPLPLMRWIKPDGTSVAGHVELLPVTQTFGIGCDREGKIVSGGTNWTGEYNAQVFAVADPKQPPVIYDSGVAGDDAVLALACDPAESFCAGGGYRSMLAFLRVYHP
jgi:hypothetical protein